MNSPSASLARIADPGRSPGFVDLRAFAAEQEEALRAAAIINGRDGSAYLANRAPLLSSAGAGPVGALFLAAGSGKVDALPRDEFLFILSGSLTLSSDGKDHVLGPDDAIVLPQDCAFDWRADGDILALTMHYPDSKSAANAITPISKNPVLSPSGKPSAELLLTPAPECRNFNDYRVDEGKFVCGTWDSTPYARNAFVYRHYEIMVLKEGSVTFTDQMGRSRRFVKDDIVLLEGGAECAWDSREHVVKIFAIWCLD